MNSVAGLWIARRAGRAGGVLRMGCEPRRRPAAADQHARDQSVVAATERPASATAECAIRPDVCPVAPAAEIVVPMRVQVQCRHATAPDHQALGDIVAATEQNSNARSHRRSSEHREQVLVVLWTDSFQILFGDFRIGSHCRNGKERQQSNAQQQRPEFLCAQHKIPLQCSEIVSVCVLVMAAEIGEMCASFAVLTNKGLRRQVGVMACVSRSLAAVVDDARLVADHPARLIQ